MNENVVSGIPRSDNLALRLCTYKFSQIVTIRSVTRHCLRRYILARLAVTSRDLCRLFEVCLEGTVHILASDNPFEQNTRSFHLI